jgi:hypothetical protein
VIDERELVRRAVEALAPPEPSFERLLRRRDRKERNRRLFAGGIAIVLALVSLVALTRAFRTAERPADEPTPKPPGIFSEVGGWIAYGNANGIFAVDPAHPGEPETQIQLSPKWGIPSAWSSDGSRLLILRPMRAGALIPTDLFVLNADGTETRLTSTLLNEDGTETRLREVDHWVSGGSFSPDGSQVVYSVVGYGVRSSIHLVDADGGTPRVLLTAGRRNLELHQPTFSPDGTQIAYFDGFGDHDYQLRVMNADGTDARIVVDNEVTRRPGHIFGLSWSPDGQRLAFGFRGRGIYVVSVDGSGFTRLVDDALYPYWSPDGSRISYQRTDSTGFVRGTLEIAAPDGTHVQRFGYGASGPWNPLVQPEQEVAEVPAVSEGLTLISTLTLVVALLALVAGAVLIRRRRVRNAGNAIDP